MGRKVNLDILKTLNQKFGENIKSEEDHQDYLTKLCDNIQKGQVIPIISNSLRIDAIFNPLEHPQFSIHEHITSFWAKSLHYPFVDKHDLSRVAQYHQVTEVAADDAREQYLDFMKQFLLTIAQEMEEDEETVELLDQLATNAPQRSQIDFTELAHDELDYPYFESKETDPLRLLARLPLPIYITTSYYSALEKLIIEEGRSTVHTHICPWSGNIPEQYLPTADFEPTPDEPVVYHLFGLDQYPPSLVLTEDDHFDFLVRVAQDNLTVVKQLQGVKGHRRLIPVYLRDALAGSALLLLGYRLQDWEFRILFRGIINANEAKLRRQSFAIQLDPKKQKGIDNHDQARKYLEKYFREPFKVEWGEVNEFVQKLWEAWAKWKS